MTEVSQAEAAVSARSTRRRKTHRAAQNDGERFTPLLTREAHTFALMRSDQRGPRMYSAICLPGWKQR
jgi:hypothetical protein